MMQLIPLIVAQHHVFNRQPLWSPRQDVEHGLDEPTGHRPRQPGRPLGRVPHHSPTYCPGLEGLPEIFWTATPWPRPDRANQKEKNKKSGACVS